MTSLESGIASSVGAGRDTCPCGQPVQLVDDHACGECATHCTLEAYRRAEAARRAEQQAADDAALIRIHAARVQHGTAAAA